jgi:hypothetical protein
MEHSYLYDLDYPESKRKPIFTLDGFYSSNVARFINHRSAFLVKFSFFMRVLSCTTNCLLPGAYDVQFASTEPEL